MRVWNAIAVAVGVVGLVAISTLWIMVGSWFEEEALPEPWPKIPQIAVVLPQHAGSFELYMRTAHPIKPQLERRITVVGRDGSRLSSAIYFQYGDPTKIRLYWHPGEPPAGPILRLEDKCAEIIVQLGKHRTDGLARHSGRVQLVPPEGTYGQDWEFSNGSVLLLDDKTGRVLVTIPERAAPDAVAKSSGTYLGLIAGRGSHLTYIPNYPSGTPISPDWPPFDPERCPPRPM